MLFLDDILLKIRSKSPAAKTLTRASFQSGGADTKRTKDAGVVQCLEYQDWYFLYVYSCCNFYRVYYCSLSIFFSSSLPGCCVQAMGNARQRAAVEMATRLCSQEILRICRLWQMSNVAMISHDSILIFSVQSMKCPGIEAKCCSCWYLACSDSHNHRIDMESSWDWICCQAIAGAVSCRYHFDLLWASPMAKKKCLKKVLARKLLKIQRWKPFELGSRWYLSMESSAAKVGDHQR